MSNNLPSPKPSNGFRILHTADWHLGKLLGDQSRDSEHQLFLDWLLETVRVHEIDSIVLAGDVFDTASPSNQAQERYYSFVSRLHSLGTCSLVIIGGNHDSPAQLEAPKRILKALNVHVSGSLEEQPENRILLLPTGENPKVAVAMIPFLRDRELRTSQAGQTGEDIRRDLVQGITERYRETAEAGARLNLPCPTIGTGHLTVMGSKRADSERDIHIGGLGSVTPDIFPGDFSYVALGHLHRPQKCDAQGRVRYSGSPIPLSFSESTDKKSVHILDCLEKELTHHELPIPLFRPLIRLATDSEKLEATLESFTPPESTLEPWLEITIKNPSLPQEALTRVKELTDSKPYLVQKILVEHPETTTEYWGETGEAEISMDNPRAIFQRVLERSGFVDDSEKQALTLTYTRILEQVLHNTESSEKSRGVNP